MSMVSVTPWTAFFPLAISRFGTDPQEPVETLCLVCESPLVIHQPDIHAPERLLGTCDTCGSWHLIDIDRAMMVLLPDAAGLHNVEAGR